MNTPQKAPTGAVGPSKSPGEGLQPVQPMCCFHGGDGKVNCSASPAGTESGCPTGIGFGDPGVDAFPPFPEQGVQGIATGRFLGGQIPLLG